MEELQKLMDDIAVFSDKTFPGQRNPGILHHLKEEVEEAIRAIEDQKSLSLNMIPKELAYAVEDEYADMLLLLLDSARSQGMDAEYLLEIAQRKMEINKKRKWGKPDKNGVIRHIWRRLNQLK